MKIACLSGKGPFPRAYQIYFAHSCTVYVGLAQVHSNNMQQSPERNREPPVRLSDIRKQTVTLFFLHVNVCQTVILFRPISMVNTIVQILFPPVHVSVLCAYALWVTAKIIQIPECEENLGQMQLMNYALSP